MTTRLLRAKVVLLGAPSVGKTSLVRRVVHSIFSEQYKSSIGVKVDRKSIDLPNATVTLLLWDLHGETRGLKVPQNYLRASSAAVSVFDSSRLETAEVASVLAERFLEASPGALVFPVANKSDLDVDWEAVDGAASEVGLDTPARLSAKDGEGVDELFALVATEISKAQLNS